MTAYRMYIVMRVFMDPMIIMISSCSGSCMQIPDRRYLGKDMNENLPACSLCCRFAKCRSQGHAHVTIPSGEWGQSYLYSVSQAEYH